MTKSPLQPRERRSRLRIALVVGALVLLIGLGLALLRTLWPRAGLRPEMTAQRITANPPEAPVTGAVISPDGKYISYSDPAGVYIREIDTGETRPLSLPKGFKGVPTSWYPDSTKLLVGNLDGPQQTPKIWRVSILGGEPRMMLQDAADAVVSPDGSRIAYFHVGGFQREMWIADADGGNSHCLVPQPTNRGATMTDMWSASWSPNGKRIVYTHREWGLSTTTTGDVFFVYTRTHAGGTRIVFVSTDSGAFKEVVVKDLPILQNTYDNGGWSADDKMVLTIAATPEGVPLVVGVDLQGNAKVLLKAEKGYPIKAVVPSPDGLHVALGVTTGESNVWMVENY